MSLGLTPSQTVGPYLHIGLTDTRSFSQIGADGAPGDRIDLKCRVFDGDGIAVPDAMIELWQADADGRYHHPEDPTLHCYPRRNGYLPRHRVAGY